MITNNQAILLFFLIIYFLPQLFSNVWFKNLEMGIPVAKNYIQNFVSSIVLIGLVVFFGSPNLINIFNYPQIPMIVFATILFSFAFVLVYCFAKRAIDNQVEKDKARNINSGKKILMIIIIVIYGLLAVMYLLNYGFKLESWKDRSYLVVATIVISLLYFSFYYFKDDTYYENKFVLPLYLYPLLFLTQGVGYTMFSTISYFVIFTTVVASWGFFGIEWFVGPAKKYEGNINREMCKAYLGISDDDTAMNNNLPNQTQINTRNINYMYIAMALIFCTFLIAIIMSFVSLKKIINRQ